MCLFVNVLYVIVYSRLLNSIWLFLHFISSDRLWEALALGRRELGCVLLSLLCRGLERRSHGAAWEMRQSWDPSVLNQRCRTVRRGTTLSTSLTLPRSNVRPVCPQPALYNNQAWAANQDEDCLYLNVYAPPSVSNQIVTISAISLLI